MLRIQNVFDVTTVYIHELVKSQANIITSNYQTDLNVSMYHGPYSAFGSFMEPISVIYIFDLIRT